MKKSLICIFIMLLPFLASANPVEIEGVWYNLITKAQIAEVTSNPSGDKYIGDITIPDKFTYDGVEYYVTKILDNAFNSCKLTSVKIGNNVTSIGNNAFRYCSNLNSVTIDNGVISIGIEAFFGCIGLTSVHITDIKAWCGNDFNNAESNPLCYAHHLYLNGEEIKDLVIPNSVESIGNYAFSGCSGLTSVTIPNSVESIGNYAFSGCSGLTSVIIPNNVTSIGEYTFSSCSGLTSVTIGDGVTSIGNGTFFKCISLTSVTISNSVRFIGKSAFSDCSGLTSVNIPNNVESIGEFAFAGCSVLTSVNIGNSVTSIGNDAFHRCSCLTTVNIPNSMESIGNYAFSQCSALTSVSIPNNVMSIGNYAFSGCSGLTSVTIPNSMTSIGEYVFEECSGLTSVTIPNSVTFIGSNAFKNCNNLNSVTIPNRVTSIGYKAFSGCSGLTSVTIGYGVTNIGDNAFERCAGLISLHILDIKAWCGIYLCNELSNPLYYAHHLYLNGEEIKDLIIPNSVESIGNYAFSGCSGLTSVTIPSSMRSIGNSAFGKCELLADVYCIPDKVRHSLSGEGLWTNSQAFADSYQEYITLHVPAESAEAYAALEPWKNFKEIVGLNGEEIPETPEIPATPKCATPTISLVDGKITFSCETEGVEYISNISVSDARDYYDNEISAPKKFKVTVYATKASYDNSDTATAEFDFSGDTSLSGDVDGNGKVNVADHVKLSSIIMDQNE